jgi:hypothetical protein
MSIPLEIAQMLLSSKVFIWNDAIPMSIGPGPNPYQKWLYIDKSKFAVGRPPLSVLMKVRAKAKQMGVFERDGADFFRRLFMFGKISFEEMLYATGKYYGYPTCCIKFFVECTSRGIPPCMFMTANYGTDPVDVPYVRCPSCRKGGDIMRCVVCGREVDREEVLERFNGLFDQADAFGMDSLTDQQQTLVDDHCCADCYYELQ